MADIQPHPRYGAPLGGAPVTIDGVTFRPYRSGVMQTVRCSDDWRITVTHVERSRTAGFYTAAVDGVYLVGAGPEGRARHFRDAENAMRAGVRAWRERGAVPHSRL
jgi:hypothetical protein